MATRYTRLTHPLVRDGGELRPADWDAALDRAALALSVIAVAFPLAELGGWVPAAPGVPPPALRVARQARRAPLACGPM